MNRVLGELMVRVRTPFSSPAGTPAGSRRNSLDAGNLEENLEEYLMATSELMNVLENTGFISGWDLAPRHPPATVVPAPVNRE